MQLIKKITWKYCLTADCRQSLIYITVLILQNTSGFRFKLSYVYTPDITLFLAQVGSVLKPIKMTSLTSCKSPSTSNSPLGPTLHLNLTTLHDAWEAASLSFHIRNPGANQLGKLCNPIIHLPLVCNSVASLFPNLQFACLPTNVNIKFLTNTQFAVCPSGATRHVPFTIAWAPLKI